MSPRASAVRRQRAVVASLVGFLRDFDAAAEAFAIAAERWPRDGTPANPGAWLTQSASNRAIDRLRREL